MQAIISELCFPAWQKTIKPLPTCGPYPPTLVFLDLPPPRLFAPSLARGSVMLARRSTTRVSFLFVCLTRVPAAAVGAEEFVAQDIHFRVANNSFNLFPSTGTKCSRC